MSLGAIFLHFSAQAQNIKDYINEHASTSELEPFSIDFAKSNLLDADLIFFGFIHGGASPQLMDFELLKAAVQSGGVRHYIPEVNVSQAFFLNRYLSTGDLKYLDFVLYFYTMKIPQDVSVQLREKWIKIHQLNKKLPGSQRIEVIGTDTPISGDNRLAVTHLAYMLEGVETGNPMLDSLKYFKSMDLDIRHVWSGKPAIPMVQKHGGYTYDYVHSLESRYGFSNRFFAYYDENRPELVKTLIGHGIELSELFDRKGENREEHIFMNFQKYIIPLIQEGHKVYSNFGYAHVHQSEVNGRSYLACKIKRSFPEIKQHSVLGLLAKSSVLKRRKWKKSGDKIAERGVVFERMVYKGYRTSNSWDGHGVFEQLKGVNHLVRAAGSEQVLFVDLTKNENPFSEKPYLVAYQRGGKGTQIDPNSNTLDYFQFVLLMRKSKPNIPLGH